MAGVRSVSVNRDDERARTVIRPEFNEERTPMQFTAHFKYDREITLWLSSFMARALPGTPFPEEVPYALDPCEPMLDARAYGLFMTLDVEGGQVDIAVTMVVRDFGPLVGVEPRFEDPEITWDVQDGDGAHLKTLAWNDVEGKWFEAEDPLAGLSVLDRGLD